MHKNPLMTPTTCIYNDFGAFYIKTWEYVFSSFFGNPKQIYSIDELHVYLGASIESIAYEKLKAWD